MRRSVVKIKNICEFPLKEEVPKTTTTRQEPFQIEFNINTLLLLFFFYNLIGPPVEKIKGDSLVVHCQPVWHDSVMLRKKKRERNISGTTSHGRSVRRGRRRRRSFFSVALPQNNNNNKSGKILFHLYNIFLVF